MAGRRPSESETKKAPAKATRKQMTTTPTPWRRRRRRALLLPTTSGLASDEGMRPLPQRPKPLRRRRSAWRERTRGKGKEKNLFKMGALQSMGGRKGERGRRMESVVGLKRRRRRKKNPEKEVTKLQ